MNILAINTSDQVLGLALVQDKTVLAEYMTNIRRGHAERLMPAIVQLMEEVGWEADQLEKIVVAHGPGSYTGVRIGLTTAKSLAWSLNIPIIGVSSIHALAYQAQWTDHLLCPFFDARRNRVYTGLFRWEAGQMRVMLEEQNIAMEDWLKKIKNYEQDVMFISPHVSDYQAMIEEHLGDRAHFVQTIDAFIRPSHLVLAAENFEPAEVHGLVPNYLRLAEAEANWLKQKEKTNE